MKQIRCEREFDMVGALRTGMWTTELESHVRDCAICAEAQLVAKNLLESAEALRAGDEPVSANHIWRQAQARKQEMALRRATQPLIFMRRVSFACMTAFVAWLLHSFWHIADGALMRGWNGPRVETAGVGAVIAVACIAVGAWYLLREDKRSDGAVSSV